MDFSLLINYWSEAYFYIHFQINNELINDRLIIKIVKEF